MLSNFAVLCSDEEVTQPTILSLANAKSHLNITHSHQDDLIQSYIDAAVAEAEDYTNRALRIYSVTIKSTQFVDKLLLTKTPYKEGLRIQYYDPNGTLLTLGSKYYVLGYHFGEPVIYFNTGLTLPELYDRQDAVMVTYKAGYGLEVMPKQFEQFCKLLVGTFYEHRTDSVRNLPTLSYNLIHKFKQQWQ